MRTYNIKHRRPIHALREDGPGMPRRKHVIGWEGLETCHSEDNLEETSSETEESPSKQYPPYILECAASEYSPLKPKREECEKEDGSKGRANIPDNFTQRACYIIGALLLLVLLLCIRYPKDDSHIDPVKKTEIFRKDVKDLQVTFPSQNSITWESIFSGIKEISTSDPTAPSVFLLLYADDTRTAECLVQKFANNAARFLSENSPDPIFIWGNEIKINSSLIDDYGLFISTYRPEIENRHVMVVYELEDIPPTVAQSFHSLCDVDNPTVRKAAYIFTLKVAKQFEKLQPRPTAENVLRTLWSESLTTNIRDPLITRVANIVLFVQPENNVSC